MITIVGISTSAAKTVTKLDKDKYQLLLLFGDCIFRIIPAKHLGNCRPLPKGR